MKNIFVNEIDYRQVIDNRTLRLTTINNIKEIVMNKKIAMLLGALAFTSTVASANTLTNISSDSSVQALTSGKFLIHLKYVGASSDYSKFNYELKTQQMDGPIYKCTTISVDSSSYTVLSVGQTASCSQ